MDVSKTLQDNLKGKTIIEYPVINVIFDSDIQKYDVIDNGKELFTFQENFLNF